MPKVRAAGDASPGRGRGRRTSVSLAEINVVPLVDVMLVLLIIFMVTAPMIQRGIDVKLPVARRASAVEGERIFITVPSTFRTDGAVFLGERLEWRRVVALALGMLGIALLIGRDLAGLGGHPLGPLLMIGAPQRWVTPCPASAASTKAG